MHEYLGQPDHVRVVVEGLGEVDHLIGGVLLVAVCGGSEEGRRSGHGNGVALGTTAGFRLRMYIMSGWSVTIVMHIKRKKRTQACTHCCEESDIVVCSMRFCMGRAEEADTARRAKKILVG